MRHVLILLFAASLLVGCEEVPTIPAATAAGSTTAQSANDREQASTEKDKETGRNAEAEIDDGNVTVTMPEGEAIQRGPDGKPL